MSDEQDRMTLADEPRGPRSTADALQEKAIQLRSLTFEVGSQIARENLTQAAADLDAAVLALREMEQQVGGGDIVPCAVCRWPVPNDDCHVCECCGFEPVCDCDPAAYAWDGQWFSRRPESQPKIVKTLKVRADAAEAKLAALKPIEDDIRATYVGLLESTAESQRRCIGQPRELTAMFQPLLDGIVMHASKLRRWADQLAAILRGGQ